MPPVTIYQRTGDRAPARAGFSLEGGSCTDEFLVKGGDEIAAITQILGDVAPAGDGSLKRTMPACHPQYPWMFASSIETVQGMGQSSFQGGPIGQLIDVDPALEVPSCVTQYWQYPVYSFAVKFTQPNGYRIVDDTNVVIVNGTYYDTSGTLITLSYPDGEWQRYTSFDIAPSAELITAQQGQTLFALDATKVCPPGVTAPHGRAFPGFPKIYLNKSGIKFTWYNVPYSYIEHPNSYVVNQIGTINQKAWYGWPAGQLLYLGCVVRPYMPPVPNIDTWTGYNSFENKRRCDITFMFDRVPRTQSSVPAIPNGWPSAGGINPNIVASGHNLQPWMGDKNNFFLAVYPRVPATLDSGTLAVGGLVTVTLAGSASGIAGNYNGCSIITTGGTGKGQERIILSYNGARVCVLDKVFNPATDATTTYRIAEDPATGLNDTTRWVPTFPSINYAHLFRDPAAP